MLEPVVTITDYIISIQCLYMSVYVFRKMASIPWVLLFGSLGAASLVGGTVHGFLPDEASLAYAILWRLVLIFIGVAALAEWYVGCAFLKNMRVTSIIRKLAIFQFFVFSYVIIIHSQSFVLEAVNCLPPSLFIIVVFCRGYAVTDNKNFIFGASGVILSLFGSFIQAEGVSLHHVYFNHNALYHVIEFFSIYLLFIMARWTLSSARVRFKMLW